MWQQILQGSSWDRVELREEGRFEVFRQIAAVLYNWLRSMYYNFMKSNGYWWVVAVS